MTPAACRSALLVGCGLSSPGARPIQVVNRTSEVVASTGVTAVSVRLSIMPQLLVHATPIPLLIAWTPLLISSAGTSSKATVKST